MTKPGLFAVAIAGLLVTAFVAAALSGMTTAVDQPTPESQTDTAQATDVDQRLEASVTATPSPAPEPTLEIEATIPVAVAKPLAAQAIPTSTPTPFLTPTSTPLPTVTSTPSPTRVSTPTSTSIPLNEIELPDWTLRARSDDLWMVAREDGTTYSLIFNVPNANLSLSDFHAEYGLEAMRAIIRDHELSPTVIYETLPPTAYLGEWYLQTNFTGCCIDGDISFYSVRSMISGTDGRVEVSGFTAAGYHVP